MRFRIAVACLVLAWAGCGNGGSTSGRSGSIGAASNTYVYASNAGNRTILAFQVNTDTGALLALPRSPFAFSGTAPARLTTDLQGRLLFVADGQASSFSVYLIDPATGILTSVGVIPNAAPPRDLAVDPATNLLYVLSLTQISAFRFDANLGTITAVAGSPFPVGAGLGTASGQRMAIDPAGRFLYVTNLTEILTYRIESDGALALTSRLSQPGAALTGISVHPTQPFVYACSPGSGGGQAGGIFAFSTDSTGALTPLPGSPLPAGLGMRELTLDRAGTLLAVAGGPLGAGVIALFHVDPLSGQLTQVAQSPFASPPDPVQLTIDPSGKFIYSANADLSGSVANPGFGNLAGFSIDSRTGILTPAVGSPFPVAVPAGVVSVHLAP